MTSPSLVLSRLDSPARGATPLVVEWLTWPVLFLGAMAASLHAITTGWAYGTVYSVILIAVVATLAFASAAFTRPAMFSACSATASQREDRRRRYATSGRGPTQRGNSTALRAVLLGKLWMHGRRCYTDILSAS